jgi:squalene monooxygenase
VGQLVPSRERSNLVADPEKGRGDAQYDVIIIGAGVVGGALATVLARQGKTVLVVEASLAEPDRIVGELLQPLGVEKLQSVGLSDALEGFDAQPTHGYGILLEGRQMSVNYEPAVRGGAIPEGRGFHNGRLLMKLREIARREPNVTLLEATVTNIMRDGDRITGIQYDQADRSSLRARAHLTVVADGCFSRFRGLLHDAQFTKTVSHPYRPIRFRSSIRIAHYITCDMSLHVYSPHL